MQSHNLIVCTDTWENDRRRVIGMKRITWLLILVMILGTATIGFAAPGVDMPSGSHYNLNIIGVPQDKTADMSGSNGHVIFMPLWRIGKINLIEGATYQVLDKNGTDGNGASFQLPNPDPENDGTTVYSVFARALGKPGGKANMTTGFIDEFGQTWMSVCTLELERTKGPAKFMNVSKELLYVYVDMDGDGFAEHYNLFNDVMESVFWEYDNQGLKLLQLRFYEVETVVPDTIPVE